MGDQSAHANSDSDTRRRFTRRVLDDLRALERMGQEGLLERGITRVGLEQEMVLLDADLRPSPMAMEVLAKTDDDRITNEIAKFNLECNGHPVVLEGGCLSAMRAQLIELMDKVALAAAPLGVTPLLTGICPTLELNDLTRENITPKPRYYALDDELRAMRGTDYELRIKGADELIVKHPSVMLEALNTSFQLHFQVSPDDFAAAYNVAQAIAGPQLAASVNSPILFGKRLWRETRIAIFQQVVDCRSTIPNQRELVGRVRFGEDWVKHSVLDIFRKDVSQFRPILATDTDEDALAELDAGRIPKLRALQAFNSTVYRWNRPCYGVTDGKPHLRIENRLLPAGPTIEDEVANAALWFGLMVEGPRAWPGLTERLDFDDARSNFTTAAREGLTSVLTWLDGEVLPASEVVIKHFLPVARAGLERMGVDAVDIHRSLGVIEQRCTTLQTGAAWTLRTVAAMRGKGTRSERLHAIAACMMRNAETGAPVHTWPVGGLDATRDWRPGYARVGQYMTTELFTVTEDECLDLVASIMDWERLRHVPVEDHERRLVGLVSYRKMLRLLAEQSQRGDGVKKSISVADIMVRDPISVSPDTPTLDAIDLMHRHGVACLPVVEDGRLVGIISERDYMSIAREMLARSMQGGASGSSGTDGAGDTSPTPGA